MNTIPDSPEEIPNANPDPLSGEAGAHPVATGIGAATVGVAGLAASAMVAGPIGVTAAAIGGAVIGGYVGKAAGELIDPTAEAAFWREQHPRQPYAQPRVHDDDYFAAYRIGYVGYSLFNGHERTFEDAEAELRRTYEGTGAQLSWERARVATRAAWDRVHRGEARRAPATSEAQHAVHESMISQNLQSGALSNAQMPR
ncbi:MAG: hypothetical protein QOE70_1748 [Chthoniobacter sp.]|jgi:hypothetical protein|nr:hypothetical protein [Chthoniobacter sp.]